MKLILHYIIKQKIRVGLLKDKEKEKGKRKLIRNDIYRSYGYSWVAVFLKGLFK